MSSTRPVTFEVMRAAMGAKFAQHAGLRAVLGHTGDAQLWHGTSRGQPPQRILDLEHIRAELGAGQT